MADQSKDEAGDGQPRPAQALFTNSPHIVEIMGGNDGGGGTVAGGSPNSRGGVSFKTNQSAMASFKNYRSPLSLGKSQHTSYYSNHYNRRLDSFMEIRFKTKAEVCCAYICSRYLCVCMRVYLCMGVCISVHVSGCMLYVCRYVNLCVIGLRTLARERSLISSILIHTLST